ncbi:MAG: hypothetical protein FJ293_11950 [Planctomycetes bacterium]|nr:hypothetical protein [Planctomycetota bacterium]
MSSGSDAPAGGAKGGARGGANEPPQLVLLPSASLVWLGTLIGAAMIVVGALVGGDLLPRADPRATDRWFAGGVALMGVAVVAGMGPMAWAPRPILVADARGLHYLLRFGKGASFAWDELAAVGWVRAGKHSGFGLWMRDRQAWLASLPGWQQPLHRLGQALGRPERRLSVLAGRQAINAFAAQIAQHYPVEAR